MKKIAYSVNGQNGGRALNHVVLMVNRSAFCLLLMEYIPNASHLPEIKFLKLCKNMISGDGEGVMINELFRFLGGVTYLKCDTKVPNHVSCLFTGTTKGNCT